MLEEIYGFEALKDDSDSTGVAKEDSTSYRLSLEFAYLVKLEGLS